MADLGMCLPHVKCIFNRTSKSIFSLGLKKPRFCYFQECLFDQLGQFNNNTFSKIYSAINVLGICLPYV